MRRARIATAVVLTLLTSCRLTEVALVTVRNETASEVAVQVRLPGDRTFRDDLSLEPAQESTLLKYEERRGSAQPMPSLIDGLQMTSNGCVGTLAAPALAAAAVRTEHPRRWTLRITKDLLETAGCPRATGP